MILPDLYEHPRFYINKTKKDQESTLFMYGASGIKEEYPLKGFLLIPLFFFTCFTFVLHAEAASYSDVSATHPSYDAIQWAANNGIATGNNRQFNPTSFVTEAQFAKMYVEFFHFPATPNERTNSPVWSDLYYDRLSYFKAPVKGTNNHSVRGKSINRGTLAQLIAFAHGKSSDLTSAVTYLMAEGISLGQNMQETDPAKKFGATNSLTRAQAVTFLYRMAQNKQNILSEKVLSGAGHTTSPPSDTLDTTKLYNVGGNLCYYVSNANYNAFELSILSGNDKIGGYITKKGTSFEGFTIGQAYTGAQKVTKSGKQLSILVDKLNGNKINAIYWEKTDATSAAKFGAMRSDTSPQKYTSLEYLLVELMNVARTNSGVPALKYDYALAKVAKSHSVDMRKNNYFDHYNLKGLSPFDRMTNAGLKFSFAGENLGFNYPTIFEAHHALLNSKGHRENIYKKEFAQSGVGIIGGYYTIKFITYLK